MGYGKFDKLVVTWDQIPRCVRCEAALTGECDGLCGACSIVINRIVKRWAEGDRNERTDEFAPEVGLAPSAVEQRISRMGIGKVSGRHPRPRRGTSGASL